MQVYRGADGIREEGKGRKTTARVRLEKKCRGESKSGLFTGMVDTTRKTKEKHLR